MVPPESSLKADRRLRAKQPLLLGCALVAGAVFGAATYRVIFGGPYVYIVSRTAEKTVDLHFLDEYCIGIAHIRLTDRSSDAIIWEVVAVENKDTGICSFKLHLGPNPVRVGQPPDYQFKVLHPAKPFFYLQKGRKYELTIWGNNGAARWGVTHQAIRF